MDPSDGAGFATVCVVHRERHDMHGKDPISQLFYVLLLGKGKGGWVGVVDQTEPFSNAGVVS